MRSCFCCDLKSYFDPQSKCIQGHPDSRMNDKSENVCIGLIWHPVVDDIQWYQTRQWRRLRWSRRRSPPSCCCTSTLSSTLASALAAGNFFAKTRSQLVVSFQFQSWRKVVTYMWCLSLTDKVKSYKNSMKQPKRPTSVIYVLWCFKPELLLFKTG